MSFSYSFFLPAGWTADVMAGAGMDILGHELKLVTEAMHRGGTRWKDQTPGHSIPVWPAYLTFT